MSDDKLLSKPEIAERLQMTERWVSRRIADGDIKAVRMGKYVRVPASEVERYLSENTIAANKETG